MPEGSPDLRDTVAIHPLLILIVMLGFVGLGVAYLTSDTSTGVILSAQASYAANAEGLDAECSSKYSYNCKLPQQYDTRTGQPCGVGRVVISKQVEGKCVTQNKAEASCVVVIGEQGGCIPLQETSGSGVSSAPSVSADAPAPPGSSGAAPNNTPSFLSPDSFTNQPALTSSNDIPSNVLNPQPLQDQTVPLEGGGTIQDQVNPEQSARQTDSSGNITQSIDPTGETQSAPATQPQTNTDAETNPYTKALASGNTTFSSNDPSTLVNENTPYPSLSQKIDDEIMKSYTAFTGDTNALATGLNNVANDINMERYYNTDAISAETKANPEYQEISSLMTGLDTPAYPSQLPNQLTYASADPLDQSISGNTSVTNGANDVIDLRDAPLDIADFPKMPIQFIDQSDYYNWFYNSVGYPTESYVSQLGSSISSTVSGWGNAVRSFFNR